MEKSQAESANKRQHDANECNVQCKRQRLESDDKQLNQPSKITDLDDLCLVKIFKHLNLKELLNVCETNKLLIPAARHVYKCKFGTKTVRISGCDDLHPNTRANARAGHVSKSTAPRESFPGSINIRHLKWSLLFLRCFGPSITHLSIYYNKSKSHRYQYVHQYINQYCAKSLLEISFRDMSNMKIQHFNERPFVNVARVNVFDCHLGNQLPSMVEWFPNLRTLQLSKIRFNHRLANTKFPHLEHFQLNENDSNGFTMDDIATFLPINRQLRSVNIATSYMHRLPITRLLDIIRENGSIEKLTVHTLSEIMFRNDNSIDIDRFANEHPGLIELDLLFSEFKANDAIALHRQLKSLKKLNFLMIDSEYAKLQSNLDNGWITQSYMNFVTMRRQ